MRIYHELLHIEKIDNIYKCGKNDLFSLVIMLKDLLRDEEFEEMIEEIKKEVGILDDLVNVIPLSKILSKINKEIIMLGEDVTKDLKFSIEYEFESTGCSACEKARKEREKNETKG